MTCCYERIFRSPRESDVRKGGRLDGEDCRCSWVDDGDGRVMTFGIAQWERVIIAPGNVLAKARISPEGEKPTLWTHPPAGLAYSPQTVLKGNLSPQTLGPGLSSDALVSVKTPLEASVLTSCQLP
jgi:hypothetical protein